MPIDSALRADLLGLAAADRTVRRALVDAGQLYGPHLPKDWYHPRMAEVHHRNNARLRAIIAEHGWPGRSLVGEDGAEAAWFIAQHAVLDVDLQRQALALLEAAVAAGEAQPMHMAMLTDRVRMAQGKPQVYGCVHVDDGQGRLVPYPIEDPAGVEARRAAVGLPPLSEKTAELKARVVVEAEAGGWKLEAGGKMPEQEQRLVVTDAWRAAYPGAAVGVLALTGAANPAQHPALDARKAALEQSLRERYGGLDRAALAQLPVLQAYAGYYKRFKKTYHIALQLESVVFKGKSLPNVAALVEAMFMAELDDLLLTAGHDLDTLALPLTLDVARGDETYTLLRGDEQTLKAGDMFIRDGEGVISSIIYGPDRRTQITPETQAVVFTVYAPPGVGADAVEAHLQTLQANVRLIAPEAKVALSAVITADGSAAGSF